MARASDIFLKKDRAKNAKAWMRFRGGVSFLIRSSMNEAYQKAVNAPGRDLEEDYYEKAVATFLILDWKGLDNENGDGPLECNAVEKLKLLNTYTEIGAAILNFSTAPSNFVESNFIDDELGN